MLSSFKKPRKNASAAKQQKINVAKKLAARPVSPPSSDSESDSSDSEYEEILISSLNGKPNKKQALAPQVPVDEPANHGNHFQEPTPPVLTSNKSQQPEVKVHATHAAPIPIPPRKKSKSKKVVIKKYYQRKVPEPEPPLPATSEPPTRTSYIGISNRRSTHTSHNPHSTMSSRILNW